MSCDYTVLTLLQVRLFNFLTGKVIKVIDETLQQYTELQQVSVFKANISFKKE